MSFHAAEILGEERASCLPSSRSTVLMKLSSGRVSRTNRRFNFLNALISPGWDIGPSLYPVIPSRRMRRCLGSNRWRSRPRGRKRGRVRFLVSRKKFLRGGGEGRAGRGERRWGGGGHTREPQLAVAATCRRVPREPRDPACPLFFPPLVSSLTALLRLLCRTEIVIYVRTTFPSFSSENRTDLSSFFALLRVLLVSI